MSVQKRPCLRVGDIEKHGCYNSDSCPTDLSSHHETLCDEATVWGARGRDFIVEWI